MSDAEQSRSEQRWVAVADADRLAEDGAIEVIVKDRIIAVFRDKDQLFAIDGMCAHQGGPIAQGSVAHGCVTCPWHGWQYELATGIQTVNRKPLQETFPVRRNNDQIEVQLPDD